MAAIKMGDIIRRRIRQNESTPPTDYATTVGQSLIDRLVNHVVDNGVGIGTNTNPIEHVQQVLSVAKDLAGVSESREKRLMDENESLRSGNNGGIEGLAKLLEVLIPVIKGDSNPTDDVHKTYKVIIDQQNEHHKEVISLLKDTLKPKEEDNFSRFLKDTGMEFITANMSRDTRKEYMEDEAFWRKKFGSNDINTGNVYDFEKYKFDKRIALEEKRWEEEKELGKEEREKDRVSREQTSQIIAAVFGGGVGQFKGPGAEQNQQIEMPNIFKLECGACHKEFILNELVERVHCPFCKTELIINGGADNAQVQ